MKTETSKRRTIVFDLDGSLETPYYDEAKSPTVKAWMAAHPTGCAFDRMQVTIEACGQKLPHLPGGPERAAGVQSGSQVLAGRRGGKVLLAVRAGKAVAAASSEQRTIVDVRIEGVA